MAQRDKNGENASERVARKFLNGEAFTDCNTTSTPACLGHNLSLYGTQIAWINGAKTLVRILGDHAFDDSRLTKERKRAIVFLAGRKGIKVEGAENA